MSTDAPNVVVETIKRAEDGEDLIVRCFECYNQRGPVTLAFGGHIVRAVECDLLERNEQPVDQDGNRLVFQAGLYQIRTFRVSLTNLGG